MILEQIIRQKILEEGPISFSEFMAFALYDKDNGFYSHGGAGRRKDFITSPEVGPLFGKLVAKSPGNAITANIATHRHRKARSKSITTLESY